MPQIDALLQVMTQQKASDLHLRVGQKPRLRIHGELEEVGTRDLTQKEIETLLFEILTREQVDRFAQAGELDFAYGDLELGRYRCNCFRDHWGLACVFRAIPARIPSLTSLGLPPTVRSFAHLQRGLVLVTGATGSGKTSTLASLLDLINETYRRHIITLEDPIEYLHAPKRSIIHQRGMHYDIDNFGQGIVDATREDPDVLMIGELRDLESIRYTLTAAELGMLVFGTLHTNGAVDSIDRLVDVFPPGEQPQVRTMLSQCLSGVMSQVLLPRCDIEGRVAATEVLVVTPAVSNIVREGKSQDLHNAMQSGRNHGMCTLDDSLRDLLTENKITREQALAHAVNKASFEKGLRSREARVTS